MPPRTAAARSGTRRKRTTTTQNRENPQALEAAPVEIKIEEMADYAPSINWLLYGPEGHGKTVLAGGAPNAVFLSTETGGPVSAKRAGSAAGLIVCPDWEHAISGVRYAEKHLGPDDFLIVDSHTRLQMEYIRWLLRMKNEESGGTRDLDIPAIQDHQKWQNGFTRWTDRIIAAPFNAIFIATDMIKENEDGDDIVMPSFTGKNYAIAKYIASQMMIVSYYAVSAKASTDDEVVRRLLFQPFPPYIAKDRYSVFGRYQDVSEKEYTAMAEFIGMIRDSIAA